MGRPVPRVLTTGCCASVCGAECSVPSPSNQCLCLHALQQPWYDVWCDYAVAAMAETDAHNGAYLSDIVFQSANVGCAGFWGLLLTVYLTVERSISSQVSHEPFRVWFPQGQQVVGC